jgi:WD40 repeat protein
MATLRGHTQGVNGVRWSPDGRRLAGGYRDGTIRLWDAGTGREMATLRGHTQGVNGVRWSPDGRRLASASLDATVKLWDPEAGREVLTLRGHPGKVHCAEWSPNGRLLASGGQGGVLRIWDATKGYLAERSAVLLDDVADPGLRGEVLARQGRWGEAAAEWEKAAGRPGGKAAPWLRI